jgi:hypothetical protein
MIPEPPSATDWLARKNKPNLPIRHTPTGQCGSGDVADDLNNFVGNVGRFGDSFLSFVVIAYGHQKPLLYRSVLGREMLGQQPDDSAIRLLLH